MEKLSRLQKERNFHDNRFGGDDSERTAAVKYYLATKVPQNRYREIIYKHLKNNSHLLEYGCGTGGNLNEFMEQGAKVTGIDISPEGIKKANNKFRNNNADFFVMDAENTTFNSNSFNIVIGGGIIHHLDIKKSYNELSRILKTNGHVVFFEPLGHNPFINLYRKLTPKMRTDDEHPLKLSDVNLLKKYFYHVEPEYYCLFTLLGVPFKNTLIFNILSKIDSTIFYIFPFMKRYAWIVLIHAYNPIK